MNGKVGRSEGILPQESKVSEMHLVQFVNFLNFFQQFEGWLSNFSSNSLDVKGWGNELQGMATGAIPRHPLNDTLHAYRWTCDSHREEWPHLKVLLVAAVHMTAFLSWCVGGKPEHERGIGGMLDISNSGTEEEYGSLPNFVPDWFAHGHAGCYSNYSLPALLDRLWLFLII